MRLSEVAFGLPSGGDKGDLQLTIEVLPSDDGGEAKGGSSGES